MVRKTNLNKRKFAKLMAALTLAVVSIQAKAQAGAAALAAAETEVRSYFDPATTLIYAIGAVVGLIGGLKVYNKWNNGDPDTQKVAVGWFGAALFLVAVASVLQAFFA